MNKKKTVFPALVVVCFFVFLIVISVPGLETKAEENTNNNSKTMTLKLFGEKYTGVYSGETRGELPSGTGQFVSDDGNLTCSGEWLKGNLNGTATISYSDGSVITGSFSDGIEEGLFRKTINESSWEDTFFSEGYVCGNRCLYEDGKQANRELFVNGIPLNDFRKEAVKLSAQVLDEKSYLDHCIYVEGEVAYVGRDEENCYCRIEDDVLGFVFFRYTDTTGSGSKQAILPNMENGDKVRIYGFYNSYIDDIVLSDTEGYGYSFPSINPLYGEYIEEFNPDAASEEEDRTESEKTEISDAEYEQHKQYPYRYYGMAADQSFTVQKSMKKGARLFVFANKIEDPEKDIYILIMDDIETGGYLRGDQLKISGYFEGQCRIPVDRSFSKQTEEVKNTEELVPDDIRTQNYNIYPAIHVISSERSIIE